MSHINYWQPAIMLPEPMVDSDVLCNSPHCETCKKPVRIMRKTQNQKLYHCLFCYPYRMLLNNEKRMLQDQKENLISI